MNTRRIKYKNSFKKQTNTSTKATTITPATDDGELYCLEAAVARERGRERPRALNASKKMCIRETNNQTPHRSMNVQTQTERELMKKQAVAAIEPATTTPYFGPIHDVFLVIFYSLLLFFWKKNHLTCFAADFVHF